AARPGRHRDRVRRAPRHRRPEHTAAGLSWRRGQPALPVSEGGNGASATAAPVLVGAAIEDRLAALSALRILLLAVALGLPAATGRWTDDLLVAGAAYAVVIVAAEVLRRARHGLAS